MKKRVKAQAKIIVTILLILLVLVLIAVLWNLLFKLFNKNIEISRAKSDILNVNIGIAENPEGLDNPFADKINLSLQRGKGELILINRTIIKKFADIVFVVDSTFSMYQEIEDTMNLINSFSTPCWPRYEIVYLVETLLHNLQRLYHQGCKVLSYIFYHPEQLVRNPYILKSDLIPFL